MKDEIMALADAYAHCYAFVGDESMPIARATFEAAVEKLEAELEQERTDYKSKCAELELVHEALETAKKDAARMDFLEANAPNKTLDWHRKYKWAYHDTFTNYEFYRHKTARAAIDSAMEATK